MPNQLPRTLGAVLLAGGRSSRMGQNKALLQWQGKSFLENITERLSQVVDHIVVVGNDRQNAMQLPLVSLNSVAWAKDEQEDAGPLEGIRVGLRELVPKCNLAFVTSCDVPLLKPAIVTKLLDALGDQHSIVPVDRNGRVYGMSAIYDTRFHHELASLIKARQLRVSELAKHLGSRTIDLEYFRDVDPQLDSFRNINSISDYEQMIRERT